MDTTLKVFIRIRWMSRYTRMELQQEYYSARFLHPGRRESATKACLKAQSSAQSHKSKIYFANWCGLLGKTGDEIMSVHTYTIETRAGHSPYRLWIFTDRKTLYKRSVLALCAPVKKTLRFSYTSTRYGKVNYNIWLEKPSLLTYLTKETPVGWGWRGERNNWHAKEVLQLQSCSNLSYQFLSCPIRIYENFVTEEAWGRSAKSTPYKR